MALTTLKDDLLTEFRDERVMINNQIELLDPLTAALRKPAALRLLSNTTLQLTEYICYLVSLGGLAFTVLMNQIYPFSLMRDIFYNVQVRSSVGAPNLVYFFAAVYGLVTLGVIFVFVIGRMAREIRLKNEILNVAGKELKGILGLVLERKAAVDTIEQRHMLGLSGISQTAKSTVPVEEVPNPGYK